MQTPRYIDAKDVPVIKAAVRQMLQEGTPRAHIAERLMTEYVPHDDVARLIARVPSPEVARRYRHLRHIVAGLTLVCFVWFLACAAGALYIMIARPQGASPARYVMPFFISLCLICLPGMMLAHLKDNDGMAYNIGLLLGIIVIGDALPQALELHGIPQVLIIGVTLAGAALSGISFFLRRRMLPDLRLFSAPKKDARGRYVFSDAAR